MSPKHPHRNKRQGQNDRGGGRGRGRGANNKTHNNNGPPNMQSVSRGLSWALRHNAPTLGLRMTSDGYCPVQDILCHSHPKLVRITSLDEHIRPVVETNDKQRFRLELRPAQLYTTGNQGGNGWSIISLTEEQAAPVPSSLIAQYHTSMAQYHMKMAAAASANENGNDGGDDERNEADSNDKTQKPDADSTPSNVDQEAAPDLIWCIRANQGHSLQGINPEFLLEEISADELATIPNIVHGTYFDAWKKIKSSGGLSRMNRTHIHCAAGLLNAKDENGEATVISGMRKTCQVHVYISGSKCAEKGIRWFRSDNGVLLTAGQDDQGILPLEFVSHVTDQHGKVIFDQRGSE